MRTRVTFLLVSFGLLAALFYFSDVGKILEILSRTNLIYFFFGLLLWLVGAILRTLRWQYLLKEIGVNTKFTKLLKVFIPGLFLSNLSPAKIGEPVRSVLLKKVEGESIGQTLPSIVLERMSDIVVAVGISIFGLLTLTTTTQLSHWLISSILVYIIIFVTGLYIVLSKNRTRKVLTKLVSLLSIFRKLEKFEKGLENFSINLHKSFIRYGKWETLSIVCGYTLVIWILEGVTLFIGFRALDLSVPLMSAITAVPIASLISVLTFLPGGIGSNEAVSVLFFTALSPLTMAEVMAALILARTMSFWMYAIVGATILPSLKYNYKI
jgi:uncharacterized protein (TIRG00374 family)